MKNLTFKRLRIITIMLAILFSGSMYAGSNTSSQNDKFKNIQKFKKSDKGNIFEFLINFFKKKKFHSRNNGLIPTNTPVDSIPLDGGLSILLLGAAAFGAKKIHEKN